MYDITTLWKKSIKEEVEPTGFNLNDPVQHTLYLQEKRVSSFRRKEEYSKALKESLLFSALYPVFEKATEDLNTPVNVKEGYVSNFIKDEGVNNLLRDFRSKTAYLSELALLVEKTHDKVMEKNADKKEEDYEVDEEVREEFKKEVDTKDPEKIGEHIKDKVVDATAKFIKGSNETKEKIKDSIEKAKEEIEPETDEEKVEIKERALLEKVNDIKNNRRITVLEALTKRMAKYVLVVNDSNKERYLKEDGNANYEMVLEDTKTMYTFLEMLNTLNMVKIDETYIVNLLEAFDNKKKEHFDSKKIENFNGKIHNIGYLADGVGVGVIVRLNEEPITLPLTFEGEMVNKVQYESYKNITAPLAENTVVSNIKKYLSYEKEVGLDVQLKTILVNKKGDIVLRTKESLDNNAPSSLNESYIYLCDKDSNYKGTKIDNWK